MGFDLAASLRRLKPEKQTGPLLRRSDDELPFIGVVQRDAVPILLDTTVYVDVLQRRAPQPLKDLLRKRQIIHSSVAVGELTHLFGRLDPTHPGSRDVFAQVRGTLNDIPPHRLSIPSVRVTAEAGIVTGIVARLRGLPKADRQPLMNDAMLFLQALDSGATLLSRNIADMDVIGQLVPTGRVLLYRQA